MTKTVLITGGAGYIGSHTAFYFSQKGYHPVILDTLVHNQSFDHPWATLLQYDFADQAVLQDVFDQYKPAAVIHCAAEIAVGQSVTDPFQFYQTNVNKTIDLLEAMCRHGINNLIFSSSAAVYGNVQLGAIPEQHSREPVNPYGKTKLMIEMALQDFHKAYNLNFVCLRYFNVAGSLVDRNLHEQHKPETHVLPLLINAAFEQRPFSIFGSDYETDDGTCMRDFVHVWDVAHAHWCAFGHLQKDNPSDYFNIGSGVGTSVKQLIEITSQIAKKEIIKQSAKKRPGDPALLIADATRAANILKWKPQYSNLPFIIQTAVQSFKKQQEENN